MNMEAFSSTKLLRLEELEEMIRARVNSRVKNQKLSRVKTWLDSTRTFTSRVWLAPTLSKKWKKLCENRFVGRVMSFSSRAKARSIQPALVQMWRAKGMDPFSIETYFGNSTGRYFFIALIPLWVGGVLREFGVDEPTIELVQAVVFLVAAIANFLIW